MPRFPIHRLTPRDVGTFGLAPDFWPGLRAPAELYVQGSDRALGLLGLLPERGLAIVGTREPLQRSLQEVRRIVQSLSGERLILLSGFARGIDAAAHESAIRAGLPTVAVLGCGVDVDYPKEQASLRERILAQDGLLISEYAPGSPARAAFFLLRNRLIASFSKAVWIVEASHRSGALNTANWARQLGRTCFATPCFPGDPALAGNQGLLEAQNTFPLWSVRDLGQAWLELGGRPDLRDRRRGPARRPTERADPRSWGLPDEEVLRHRVSELTSEQNGAQVPELLDWAVAKGWTPQRFFVAFQAAIRSEVILDRSGLIISGG